MINVIAGQRLKIAVPMDAGAILNPRENRNWLRVTLKKEEGKKYN